MSGRLMDTPQRKRLEGPRPELDAYVSKAVLDEDEAPVIYAIEQGDTAVVLSHEQVVLVAAELMDAHDEEERRRASL